MSNIPDHSTRAHALLSASSAHRWLHCPPSALASELYPAQDSEFTREGTLAHEVAELIARGMPLEDLAFEEGFTQEMIDCAEGYRDYIQEQTRSKNAVILLEQRVDFSPWVPEGFGTADCIIIQDKVMDVIDYKFGKGVMVSAEDNEQEMLYGLGALNDFGIAYDVELVRLHIYQPRLNTISVWEIHVADLERWAEETVKPRAQEAFNGSGEYAAGVWCRFCPHAGKCRTLTTTCMELVNHNGNMVGIPTLQPHEIADILRMEPVVSLWIKRVKTQAMDSLLRGEQIPGYKVVEGKQGNRKWTNELNVRAALRSAGFLDSEITETKLLSPAAIDKVVGRKRAAELLSDLIERAPGAPTIAPITDMRPSISTADDFEVV